MSGVWSHTSILLIILTEFRFLIWLSFFSHTHLLQKWLPVVNLSIWQPNLTKCAFGLRKLLTRSSEPVSISYTTCQGVWQPSSIYGPAHWMLEVSSHFKSWLAGGFDLWHPQAFFFPSPVHIWSFPDEHAPPWLSNEQIRSLLCPLVCQNVISSWWWERNPRVSWAN